MKTLRLLKLTSCILFLALTTKGVASTSPLNLEGVVSVGYLSPSANRFVAKKDGEGALLIENIVRANYSFGNGFSLTGQLVQRQAGDYVDESLQVDFLQAEYRNKLFAHGEQSFLIGRFKIKQGLYNQARDISFARPTIIMPQSVYLDSIRNFLLSADGISFNSNHSYLNSDFAMTVSYGKSVFDDKFSTVAIAETAIGDWDSKNNVYADLSWESANMSLGISYSDVAVDYSPNQSATVSAFPDSSFAIPLINGQFSVSFYTISAQYRMEFLEFTAEAIKRDIFSKGFLPMFPFLKSQLNGAYFQSRYFYSDRLTFILRYDQTDYDTVTNNPDALKAKDFTIGMNWRIDENWMVALEHHFIEGGAWIPPFSITNTPSTFEKNWSLSAFQVSYMFE